MAARILSLRFLFTLLTVFAAICAVVDAQKVSHIEALTADNFEAKTRDGTWIVEFFAPWCPHCKRLKPKYERVAQQLEPWKLEKNFHISNVDCVAFEKLCDKFGIDGFPTLYVFQNGQRIPKLEYDGDRTFNNLRSWVKDMAAKYPAGPPGSGNQPKIEGRPEPVGRLPQSHDPPKQGAPIAVKPPSNQPPAVKEKSTSSSATSSSTSDLEHKQIEFSALQNTRRPTKLGKYGKVVDLTSDNFEEITSNSGPWLLEFYAPWCGHCQKLEPVYAELGRALSGKMNVGRIDVDTETELGTRFGIRGFPTIKLYHRGSTLDFRGPRTLEDLRQFALSARTTSVTVRPITAAEFARIKLEHDVSIVFAYDGRTTTNEMKAFLDAAESWLLPSVTAVYASTDSAFSHGPRPAVLVYRRGYDQPLRYPPAAIGAPDEEEDSAATKDKDDDLTDTGKTDKAQELLNAFTADGIRKFVRQHRYPLLPELDDSNAQDIMDGASDEDLAARTKRVVVLGIVDPKNADTERAVLSTVAQNMLRDHNSQMNGVRIMIVWLNGAKWADYIQRVYSLSTTDLPRVVISVPAAEEYYAHSESGGPIAFTIPAISDAVEDVVRQVAGITPPGAGKLHPASTRGRVVGMLKAGWRSVARVGTTSPWILVAGLGLLVFGSWWTCCRAGRNNGQVQPSKWD